MVVIEQLKNKQRKKNDIGTGAALLFHCIFYIVNRAFSPNIKFGELHTHTSLSMLAFQNSIDFLFITSDNY